MQFLFYRCDKQLKNQKVRIFANGSVETVIIISADQSFVKAINIVGANTDSLKLYNTLNIDYIDIISLQYCNYECRHCRHS
jgi:hypothetical protein